MTDEKTQLDQIVQNLVAARAHLARIRQMLERLKEEGMYDAVPSESWQDRGGKGRYLYHYFPVHRTGVGYMGPDGKKKVYVGADPARIAEARRLATNRRHYNKLARAARKLKEWITYKECEIQNLAAHSARYPTFDFRTLTD